MATHIRASWKGQHRTVPCVICDESEENGGAMSEEANSIQIVFCDPAGQTRDGPLIVRSTDPPIQFDDNAWSEDQAICAFHEFLRRKNGDGLPAAIRALDRHDCWRAAFRQFTACPGPDEVAGSGLLEFWITYGLQSIPLALKGDLILVIEAFKHLLPPYIGPSLTLYRGELQSRHRDGVYGLSWTPDIRVARMFSDRRRSLGEGLGVVVRMEAVPE